MNRDWPRVAGLLHEQADELDNALTRVREIFNDRNEVRKWNGRIYEKRINRAVFDIMSYYFSNPQIREASRGREKSIEDAFKRLCEADRPFLASIEQTTKSREANRVRFLTWARVLGEVLESSVEAPFAA